MTDKMFPLPMKELTKWIITELETYDSVFGLPRELFFRARSTDPFSISHAGHSLETPVGVAAGPHTQLAQNIISAYLIGARFIELKTIQPLDTIEVSKPCIDMQDLGYNCEWSQELRLDQSWNEYIKAWILVRFLRQELALNSGPEDGFSFNMSVGYDLAGIKGEKVQEFMKVMKDSSEYLGRHLEDASLVHPSILDVQIPQRISSNVTLSTMHGCPPDEIERIGLYLIGDLGLDTAIKLNPTLLGPEQLREILNGELGFDDVQVPDAAFEHDPGFSDALDIITSLRAAAKSAGVNFWVKLTNTLETVNLRKVLPAGEKMHYMSGRALHPLAVRLASDLQDQFQGQLDISLSGGVDAFNLPDLIAGGLSPITVCSDLLRPGGYGRLAQYMENLSESFITAGVGNRADFAWRQAVDNGLPGEFFTQLKSRLSTLFGSAMMKKLWPELRRVLDDSRVESLVRSMQGVFDHAGLSQDEARGVSEQVVRLVEQKNLSAYSKSTRKNQKYKSPRRMSSTKTSRELTRFDCIHAPCQDRCPTSQDVPDYMFLVANRRVDEAMDVVLRDNPLPYVTGTVCDHTCTSKCVRANYDNPLDIRGIKGFIASTANRPKLPSSPKSTAPTIAVVGAGPAGLSAAWFCSKAGFHVVLMDEAQSPGGVPEKIIPEFRLPPEVMKGDLDYLQRAGVVWQPGTVLGKNISLEKLRRQYDAVFLGLGASSGMGLGLDGEDLPGVFDCLDFLEKLKKGDNIELGKSVVVVGGGNSAMDAARAAVRAVGASGKVTLVYRRTQRQMPADDEELQGARDDGIIIMELSQPVGIIQKQGKVSGIRCMKMELGEVDSSGRPRPVEVKGSEFVLDADSVVVAVGQKPISSLLSASGLAIDSHGRLLVDEQTGETNLDGVFAGGDVCRGGSSIIQAIADAKRSVERMVEVLGGRKVKQNRVIKYTDEREHLLRRMKRVPAGEFDQPLTQKQAEVEAGRCLACDEYCSICVTVCPNRANMTYRVEPLNVSLPRLKMIDGKLQKFGETRFEVIQSPQVLNMADMCNECGNCETFCPTSGAPYKDKPRLCFSDESFDGQEQAYKFSIQEQGWRMDYKEQGRFHTLQKHDGELVYSNGDMEVVLSEEFRLVSCRNYHGLEDGIVFGLDVCASMFVIARALDKDANFLPFIS